MPTTNNQAQDLLDEFKDINARAKNSLDEIARKIAELDVKYAQQLINNNISTLKAAKSVLENKKE